MYYTVSVYDKDGRKKIFVMDKEEFEVFMEYRELILRQGGATSDLLVDKFATKIEAEAEKRKLSSISDSYKNGRKYVTQGNI